MVYVPSRSREVKRLVAGSEKAGAPELLLIVGLPRSGTTILRDVLGTCPEIATAPFEWRFLSDPGGLGDFLRRCEPSTSNFVYTHALEDLERILRLVEKRGRASSAGGRNDARARGSQNFSQIKRTGRGAVRKLVDHGIRPSYYTVGMNFFYSEFRRDVNILLSRLQRSEYRGTWVGQHRVGRTRLFVPLESSRLQQAVSEFMSAVVCNAAKNDCRFVVDDTPFNLSYALGISKIAPIRVLHIRRKDEDTIRSMMKASMTPTSQAQCEEQLAQGRAQWAAVAESDVPSYEVIFEDLVHDPNAVLTPALHWLRVSSEIDTSRISTDLAHIGRR